MYPFVLALVLLTSLLGCSAEPKPKHQHEPPDAGPQPTEIDAASLEDAMQSSNDAAVEDAMQSIPDASESDASECTPASEVCNGLDDDCDGEVDEQVANCCAPGATRACGSSIGACKPGVQKCIAGYWDDCEGATGPAREICDGVDNDCNPDTPDGHHDVKLGTSCDGTDEDLCTYGTWTCSAGALTCSDDANSSPEVCGDSIDNDCDGETNEGCPTLPFTIRDFDVRADGSAVVIGLVGQDLWLACLNTDGSLARAPFLVAAAPAGMTSYGADVARSRQSGRIALTYNYFNFPQQPYDWRNYITFFDDQCESTKAPAALDTDLPNTNINRPGSVVMTDDGRSYVLYEHQSENKFRVLGFDAAGARIAQVTIQSPTECSGGALGRVLSLDRTSGDFTVTCEANGRSFRRYLANGTPVDPGFIAVPDSTPNGFAFHYFTGVRNAAGRFLYAGRTYAGDIDIPGRWILRAYDANAQLSGSHEFVGGSSGDPMQAFATSRGDFLVEITGADYRLALISPSAQILKTWQSAPDRFELDANDNVIVHNYNSVYRSTKIRLYE